MEAFRALPVFVAVTLALPLLVSAAERDQDSETATRPEYGLKLNAARRLDENAPSEEGDAPTYLTAFKMIGTPNEKIELIDSAEVRRGGSVLRGDTITYTFANDEVYSNGNALVARNGTIFKGPELTYHLDAERNLPLSADADERHVRQDRTSRRRQSQDVQCHGHNLPRR